MKDTDQKTNPYEDASGSDGGKRWAVLVSVAMIGAVLWPIQQNWRNKPHDSFPLSYYPMFSAKREPVAFFYYLVARDEQGARYYVPYQLIGPGGHNSNRRQIRKIVNEGRAADLARSVARRLGRQDELPWSKIVTVAVVRGKFAVDDYFHGQREPVSEEIKASCPVKRMAQ